MSTAASRVAQPGTVLAGKLRVERLIGQGAMGVVYEATDITLRRRVAVKLVHPDFVGDAEKRLRFGREAYAVARLQSQHVTHVLEINELDDGTPYLVMELLEGKTLDQIIDREGPAAVDVALDWILQALDAVAEAHRIELVHRDLKPANLYLARRANRAPLVKVLDFGLVKELAPGADLAQSSINTVMGTPHYMAPEAILDPASIDGRADLYAVGAMAYYLLTGERVFDGSNLVEICSQHLHQEPSPPAKKRSDIPASVEKIVLACLAKKREERPESAAALADMIRDAQREVGEWSRAEAKAWWTERTRSKSGHVPQAKPVSGSDASVLGQTIAVALDDRGAA